MVIIQALFLILFAFCFITQLVYWLLCGTMLGLLQVSAHDCSPIANMIFIMKNFFTNLFIPCNECQTNYEEYLSLHPISSILTREEMVQWVFDFHNSVRASKNLGVLSFDYTYLIYNNHNTNSELYRTLNVVGDECVNC